jgi:hypothetical protein
MSTVIIYRNRAKLAGGQAVLGLLLVMFIYMMVKGEGGPLSPFAVVVVWVFLTAFGAILIFGIIALFDSRPAIEVRDEGLLVRQISNDVIPWPFFVSIKSGRDEDSRWLELFVFSNLKHTISRNWHRRLFDLWNDRFGTADYRISMAMLDYDADELLRLLRMRISGAAHIDDDDA